MGRPASSDEPVDSTVVEVCDFAELEDGEARGFDPFGQGHDSVFIVRRGNMLRAYRNLCPHQGASLPWRKGAYLNANRTRIVCSAHGAQFDIDSGRCLLGPALGRSLSPVPVCLDRDGKVSLALPPSMHDGPADRTQSPGRS